ncbi:hypothetical protein LguiA_022021 [Lonicera macranthoides]
MLPLHLPVVAPQLHGCLPAVRLGPQPQPPYHTVTCQPYSWGTNRTAGVPTTASQPHPVRLPPATGLFWSTFGKNFAINRTLGFSFGIINTEEGF